MGKNTHSFSWLSKPFLNSQDNFYCFFLANWDATSELEKMHSDITPPQQPSVEDKTRALRSIISHKRKVRGDLKLSKQACEETQH